MDEMRKTVGNAAILSVVIAVVMTAVSMLGMHRLLVFMHTPRSGNKAASYYFPVPSEYLTPDYRAPG